MINVNNIRLVIFDKNIIIMEGFLQNFFLNLKYVEENLLFIWNVYFRLRFGLVIQINNCLLLTFRIFVSVWFVYQKSLKLEFRSNFSAQSYFWKSRFIFVYQKSLKPTFNTGFWVQNLPLNLCSRANNLQRLFCSQRAGVKCSP